MTKEQLSDLIGYAESAVQDGFPFEVTGDDLALVLEALKAFASEPNRDAEDAARWRFAKEQMCYSFDGQDRTHYMKAQGREDFEETIDRRRGSSENREVKP